MPKISFVMATHNRRQLLINTLKTIEYYNADRDVEVIIVDDGTNKKEEQIKNISKLFSIPVIIVPIREKTKSWTCDCIPFNIGYSFATGDIIITQNPENLHIGDIVGYTLNYLEDGVFLSFALYSMNQADTDNLYKNGIAKGIYSGVQLKKIIGKMVGKENQCRDGETCWYNHSIYQPSGHHLISAITRNDLEDLNGFDERYGKGFAYTDFELRERMKRKGLVIKIVDNPFAVHQRHALADYKGFDKEFKRNGDIFVNVTLKETIYRSPKNFFYAPRPPQKKNDFSYITNCPVTGDKDSIKFVDLGNVPLVNNLCNTREQSMAIDKFPLAVQLFTKSRLSCLTITIEKGKLFTDYLYQSGINKPYLDHCRDMHDYLRKDYVDWFHPLKFLMADIGGDDGSLLKEFKKQMSGEKERGKGRNYVPDFNNIVEFVNVDASRSFKEINEKAGIIYINEFFNENTKLPRKAGLITSTNVLQHGIELRSFVKGIKNNLSVQGIWCLEFPYLLTTLLNDNYDQIYHEHIYYFLLKNIKDIAEQEGLKIINVSFFDMHSGSLRVIIAHNNNMLNPDSTINSFLNLEKQLTDEYYMQWGERTKLKIDKFRNFIDNLHKTGKSIACFGAAAKGCVFLNTVGLTHEKIKFIIDDTPVKQGKYVPGTGLQIVPRTILKKEKIDYMIILAHNFKDYIIQSLKNQYKGKFIIMFPDIKIV